MLRNPVVAAGLLTAVTASAAEVPGPLVTPGWLADHRSEAAVVDVRGSPEAFARNGHIPGAALARWGNIRVEGEEDGVRLRKMLPEADGFRDLMRGWGVDTGEAVIITSPGKSPGHFAHAARLYWQVKYYGHDNVALLEGGNAAWAAERDLASGSTTPERGDFRVRAERDAIHATTTEVQKAIDGDGTQLVDNRSLPFYLGLSKKSYVQAPGHIPGAKLMPFMYLVAGDDALTVRPEGQLRDFAEAMGIDPDAPAITYCNSGNVGTAGWFVLHEILGNDDVRSYDGSMHAWTQDPERPTTTMRME